MWHGKRDVRVDSVPDPTISEPTDVIVRITTTGLCGSDLHLYEVLGPFLSEGDILGHEPMGIVEEVGSAVTEVQPGDRVVIPFNVSCGTCAMCSTGLLPIKVPDGPPDDRFVYLSDVLPTAWQAVAYADPPQGGSLAVLGLGPIGDMCTRMAMHKGVEKVIGIDLVPERLERARANGVEVIDLRANGDELTGVVRDMTDGRGPDAVVDAVGMEAHGSPVAALAHRFVGLLPDAVAEPLMKKGGVDRLNALYTAIDLVRRGGTISLSGVYGGMADPLPMLTLFDKQVQLRMGQANVHRWVDDLLPLVVDGDPLGVEGFATHHVPLEQAPEAYDMFQKKRDGAVKVVFQPGR
ncbi:MAG: theronine dehydrogenase-like Zn-dependent dehydrogenase [Acidimicrobiales bacterium]|nr:theronine dehydrogenase-like Zn-dependent dehydrogenase [Acidimicrobiales bacterium]